MSDAKPVTTPLYCNGWIKIVLSFVIMALAFTFENPWLRLLQCFAAGVYFCLGLNLVLDARKK